MAFEPVNSTLCVRTLLELNAIDISRLYEGVRAWVLFEKKEYRWHNSTWSEIVGAKEPVVINAHFSNATTFKIRHNLGYIPTYMVYGNDKDIVLCDVLECTDEILKLSFIQETSGTVSIIADAGHELIQFAEPEELPDPSARNFEFVNTLGDVYSTGNIIINTALDGDPALVRFNSLVLNAGHTLTTSQRCKGLFIEVMGDCHIEGAITMTARGANCPGKFICIKPAQGKITFSDIVDFSGSGFPYIQKNGGIGGRTPGNYNASPRSVAGENATGYACGGGGEGGSRGTQGVKPRAGAMGTSFSGGSGGGGCTRDGNIDPGVQVPQENGGVGGNGRNPQPIAGYGASGGAGNPGGRNSDGSKNSGDGTGGLIILIVHGNLYIRPRGFVESNGSNGGAHSSSNRSGGGGSGGGSVNIFHGGNIYKDGTVRALGGVGSGTGSSGFAGYGGAGTVRIERF